MYDHGYDVVMDKEKANYYLAQVKLTKVVNTLSTNTIPARFILIKSKCPLKY